MSQLHDGSSDTHCSDFEVSVVIPLFNKGKSIAATIKSVLRQSRPPDELIIVDDGSTDNSVSIAKRTLKNVDTTVGFSFISQENAGASAARNAGANASRSRYIAFLDGDDEWLPDYLAEVERLALAFPDASVVTIRRATRNKAGSVTPETTKLPRGFFGILDRPLVRIRKGPGIIHPSAVTIRRDAWARCGGFPVGARQGEDTFLWLKLGLSETVAHSGAALCVFHPEHSEGESRKDLVSYHFSYFLGTEEGRRFLATRDLKVFLSSHLARTIIFRRLAGHLEIQPELRRLARELPAWSALICRMASTAPLWLLRIIVWIHGSARHLRSRFSGGRNDCSEEELWNGGACN